MRVAIIGAGVAGLACAIGLERHGIKPQIFEKNHRLGSPFPYSPLILDFIFRPVKNPLTVLKKQCGINLKPISDIRLIKICGPRTEFTIQGNLGHSLLRGQEIHSIECQMAKQLKSPIQFNSPVNPKDLVKKFNYVVVATGEEEYAKDLQIWQDTYSSWIRGASILGRFNPQKIKLWFNTDYTKNGYAYLVPMGTEKATLLLNVSNTTQDKLPNFWQSFLQQERLDPNIVLLWDVPHNTSLVYPQRVGNTFFIGNSGGFVTSWLGQGLFSSMVSGIEAAHSIALNNNFQKQTTELNKIMVRQARFRQLWNQFDNKNLDRVLRLINNPLIKFALNQTNLNFFKFLDRY